MSMRRVPRILDEKDIKSIVAEEEITNRSIWGQKDCTDEGVMILLLNREKNTERIIIGERDQVDC